MALAESSTSVWPVETAEERRRRRRRDAQERRRARRQFTTAETRRSRGLQQLFERAPKVYTPRFPGGVPQRLYQAYDAARAVEAQQDWQRRRDLLVEQLSAQRRAQDDDGVGFGEFFGGLIRGEPAATRGGGAMSAGISSRLAPIGSPQYRAARAVSRVPGQWLDIVEGIPYGVYYGGQSVGLDARDVVGGALARAEERGGFLRAMTPNLRNRDLTPTRTADLAVESGRQIVEDVRNPEDRLGYLLADLLLLTPAAAGTAVRTTSALGRAGRAGALSRVPGEAIRGFREGNPPQEFLLERRVPPTVVDGQVVHPGGAMSVAHPLPRNVVARELFSRPRWTKLQEELTNIDLGGVPYERRLMEPQLGRLGQVLDFLNVPGRLREGPLGAEAVFNRELRRRRTVDEEATAALMNELKGAVRPGTRSELPRGQQFAIGLRGIFGEQALLDPDGVVRQVRETHENRIAEIEQQLNDHPGKQLEDMDADTFEEAATSDPDGVARTLQAYREAQAKAAEEIQTLEAKIADVEAAAPELARLGEAMPGTRARAETLQRLEGLRDQARAAHDADPGPRTRLTLARAESAYSEARRDLEAFDEPIPPGADRFLDAARLTKEISRRAEREYVMRGIVSPQSAEFRRAAPAALFRGEQLTEEVPVGIARGPVRGGGAARARRDIEAMDREIRRAQKRVARAETKTRPRTREEAAARLQEVEGEYERFIDTVANQMMTGAERRSEQARRNIQNARAGRTKKLGRGTIFERGITRQKLPTVREELRKEALALIAKAEKARPNDVVLQKFKRMEDEILQLRKSLGITAATGRRLSKAEREIFEETGPERPSGVQPFKRQSERELEAEAARRETSTFPGEPVRPTPGQRTVDEGITEAERRAAAKARREERKQLGKVKVPVPLSATAQLRGFREARERLVAEHERLSAGPALPGRKGGPERQEIKTIMASRRRELEAPVGSYYVDLRAFENLRKGEPTAKFAGLAAESQTGRGPVSKGRYDPTVTHEFTGETIRAGNYRVDAANTTIEKFHTAIRLTSALDMYARAWSISAPEKRSEWDTPIRSPSKLPYKLKQAFAKGDAATPLSEAELKALQRMLEEERLPSTYMAALGKHLHAAEFDGAAVGTNLTKQGVRWIDRRFLADLATFDKSMPYVDAVNNFGRLFYVYGRVAYILNLPGNLGMQVLTQGWMAPRNYARALRLRKTYDQETAGIIENLVGEGKARAYSIPTGALSKQTHWLANFWTSFIDRHSRVSAFLHHMERAGVDLDDKAAVKRFVTTSSHQRAVAARRANKDLVEFNNLSAFERNTLRHLIFIYPWMSRATVWTLRTMVEHPAKVWTLAQLSQIAGEHMDRELGPLPSYLAQRGYFPVGGITDGKAKLVNPSSLSTFSTGAENARLLGTLFWKGVGERQPREAASPALDLLVGAITGESSRGQAYDEGGLIGALQELYKSTPEYQTLRRAGIVEKQKGELPLHQQPVFQKFGSLFEAIAPNIAGGLTPREASLPVARERARLERLEGMSPTRRAGQRVRDEFDKLLKEARRVGVLPGGQVPADLRAALNERVRYETAYAKEADRQGIPSNRLSSLDRTRVDLRLLVQLGRIPQSEADSILREAQTFDEDQMRSFRRDLHEFGFQQVQWYGFRTAIAEAGGEL